MAPFQTTREDNMVTVPSERQPPLRQIASDPMFHHPSHHRSMSSDGEISASSSTQSTASPVAIDPPMYPQIRDLPISPISRLHPHTYQPTVAQSRHPPDLPRPRRSSVFTPVNEQSQVGALPEPEVPLGHQSYDPYHSRAFVPRVPPNLPRPRSPLDPFVNDPFLLNYRNAVAVATDTSGDNGSLVDTDEYSYSSFESESDSIHDDLELGEELRSSHRERAYTGSSLPGQGDDQYCEMGGVLGAIRQFFFGSQRGRVPRNLMEEAMLCPIEQQIMLDPVMAPDGYSYERQAILKWLTKSSKSPMTRRPLAAHQLTENRALKSVIHEYLKSSGRNEKQAAKEVSK